LRLAPLTNLTAEIQAVTFKAMDSLYRRGYRGKKAGVEIEASPDLSSLDEEAFRPVEPGISVHQIFSLTE
jgi:hypothetical protein